MPDGGNDGGVISLTGLCRRCGFPVGSGVVESACEQIIGAGSNGRRVACRKRSPRSRAPSNAASTPTAGPTSSIGRSVAAKPHDQNLGYNRDRTPCAAALVFKRGGPVLRAVLRTGFARPSLRHPYRIMPRSRRHSARQALKLARPRAGFPRAGPRPPPRSFAAARVLPDLADEAARIAARG